MTQLRSPERRPPAIIDAAKHHDPTETAGLRRAFRAAGQMRLRRLRALMRQALTEYDILGLAAPETPTFTTPTTRLKTFLAWFQAEADMSLGSPWYQTFTERAYRSGALRAACEVPSGGSTLTLPPSEITGLLALAQTELAGIAAALAQHVARGALYVASHGARPATAHRFLVKPFDKIAAPRLNAFANWTAVKAHNTAKIDVFRAHGVRRVGIKPELRTNLASGLKLATGLTTTKDAAGDDQVEVETAGDDLVCALCEAIAENGPYDLDDAMDLIPAHANCLPGDALVSARDGVSAVSKRKFQGQLVVIRTAAGRYLRCTPNHPILTDTGWIAAQALNAGDYVISDSGREWEASLVHHHDQYVPTAIEEIAHAFSKEARIDVIPVSSADFHGDGADSEIAVIMTDRRLRYHLQAAIDKHLRKYIFKWRSVQDQALARLGALQFSAYRVLLAATSLVGDDDLPLTLCVGHAPPLHNLGGRLVTPVDAISFQHATDCAAVNSVSFRQGIFGNTFNIGHYQCFMDRIVERSTQEVTDCHVFNLQTPSEIYCAGGIITHNCRCAVVAA